MIFEETLILHSWIYLENHLKYAFKGSKNSIACDRLRIYMEKYKKYALRKEGMGLKFLKFHQILHLWWIIRLYGSLYNVDTARCESHHIKKKLEDKHNAGVSYLMNKLRLVNINSIYSSKLYHMLVLN